MLLPMNHKNDDDNRGASLRRWIALVATVVVLVSVVAVAVLDPSQRSVAMSIRRRLSHKQQQRQQQPRILSMTRSYPNSLKSDNAALCTQTIVGDNSVYDVILLDLDSHGSHDSHGSSSSSNSLSLLAHRLRQRFPLAMMIFIQQQQQQQQQPSDDNNELLLQQVNGVPFLFPLSKPSSSEGIAATEQQQQQQQQQLDQFIKDNYQRPKQSPTDPQQQQQQLGTWGSGDSCNLWYQSNTVDTSFIQFNKQQQQQQLSIIPDTADNYMALQLHHSQQFTVHNPFPDQPRMLHITYLTALPSHHERKVYPRMQVRINGQSTVLLDPIHDDVTLDSDTQIIRTTAVGILPAATSILELEPIEGQTLLPFRMLGVSVLPTERKRMELAEQRITSTVPSNILDLLSSEEES